MIDIFLVFRTCKNNSRQLTIFIKFGTISGYILLFERASDTIF